MHKLLLLVVVFFFFCAQKHTTTLAYSSSSSPSSSSSSPEYYCAGICETSLTDSPCGAASSSARTTQCVGATGITRGEIGASALTSDPVGYLGCTETACASLCASASGVTANNPFQMVETSAKVICIHGEKEMFMTESQAKASAISKGCAAEAHAMSGMYMPGATHGACEDDDDSSSSHSSSSSSYSALMVMSTTVASLASLWLAL
jgi:hypothetical protein